MKFRPFTEARDYVHSLELKNVKQWEQYCKSDKKPDDIPSNPGRVYDEWTNWGDWLGTGTVAAKYRKYRSFEQARDYARSLGLKSLADWFEYSKSRKLPDDIPANANSVYKKEWTNWGDWLGTGTVAPQDGDRATLDDLEEKPSYKLTFIC